MQQPRGKMESSLTASISPNSRRQSPKYPQQAQLVNKNHIAINGFNNQIAIGGNNVVLNVNVNQMMKPKTPMSLYKHLNIQNDHDFMGLAKFNDQKKATPTQNGRPMLQPKAFSNQQSKQQSRNNSKISTPAMEETDWEQFAMFSQMSFVNNGPKDYPTPSASKVGNSMEMDLKRMVNSPNQQQKMIGQFAQSQMNSRNQSQTKRSPSNGKQSRNVSKESEKSATLSSFTQQQCTSQSIINAATLTMAQQTIKSMFNLQYVIGIGGFGKVWKVQHKKTQKIFAMKEMNKALVITKKSVNSVMNERQLLSQLKHTFLVNMYSAFQDRDNLYLIMDFLAGGDLRYHIGRSRRFSEEQTRFFIACIFIALEYLHSNFIIHRDIKPENLVLDSRGYVRITDLGIARIMRPENSQDTSGTPGYMAPEVMCRLNHTYSVDYFALGVIGYEFMLGKRPYLGRSRKEIRDQILARQVQIKKSELPDQWSLEAVDFINRLLQRKPQSRLGFNGPQEIRSHPWLKGFPWQKLINKELIAPFLPNSKAKEDNFDSRQISIEDEENNELIQQNILLLRRNSVQTLFDGYSFEATQAQPTQPTQRKNSLSTYTQGAQQPIIQPHKLFFNQVDSLLKSSYTQK